MSIPRGFTEVIRDHATGRGIVTAVTTGPIAASRVGNAVRQRALGNDGRLLVLKSGKRSDLYNVTRIEDGAVVIRIQTA